MDGVRIHREVAEIVEGVLVGPHNAKHKGLKLEEENKSRERKERS